jgi:hypothetical protein
MIEEIREIVGIGGVHHFTRTREAWLFFCEDKTLEVAACFVILPSGKRRLNHVQLCPGMYGV